MLSRSDQILALAARRELTRRNIFDVIDDQTEIRLRQGSDFRRHGVDDTTDQHGVAEGDPQCNANQGRQRAP